MKKFTDLLGNNTRAFALSLVVGVIFSGLSVAIPTISGKMINAFIYTENNKYIFLVAFIVLSLLLIVFDLLNEYCTTRFKSKQKSLMRSSIFNAFSKKSNANQEEVSAFISFANNDIPNLAEDFFCGTIEIIKCVCIITFSAVSLLFVHWIMAVIIVGISFGIVLLPNSLRKSGSEARNRYMKANAAYNNILKSVIEGVQLIRVFSCEQFLTGKVTSADRDIVKGEHTLLKKSVMVHLITTTLQVGKTALILTIGIFMIMNGKMEIGSLLTVVQLNNVIGAPIEVLAYLRHSRNIIKPVLTKYEELSAIPVITKNDNTESTVNSFEKLDVVDLSCSVNKISILKDLSIEFLAGKKYLITGESGSGKSTLLEMIAKLSNLSHSGEIRYNGTDISHMDLGSYYSKVCIVPQESYLFFTSLKENICLGREISDNEYQKILQMLNLQYLQNRYGDEEITPQIIENFSGGEKQRVAIARAIVGHPEVYLLDEVTSALDKDNSDIIYKALMRENATIISVCHKPDQDTISKFDEWYGMSDGNLMKVG